MSNQLISYLDKIFTEMEKSLILKNLLLQKQRVKDSEWFRIEEMLELYFSLRQQKPFATLLKGDENTAENRALVANYQTHFKNNFLQLHKQEIFNVLTSPHLKQQTNKVEAMIDGFNTVKTIHKNPEKNLGISTKQFQEVLKKDVLPSAKPKPSKVKNFLEKAAYVIGTLSLITMGFLMFPVSLPMAVAGVAMTVAHYVMFGATTVLVATKIADAYQGKQQTKQVKAGEQAFQPYFNAAYQMNSFFRRKNDTQNEIILSTDKTPSRRIRKAA